MRAVWRRYQVQRLALEVLHKQALHVDHLIETSGKPWSAVVSPCAVAAVVAGPLSGPPNADCLVEILKGRRMLAHE